MVVGRNHDNIAHAEDATPECDTRLTANDIGNWASDQSTEQCTDGELYQSGYGYTIADLDTYQCDNKTSTDVTEIECTI